MDYVSRATQVSLETPSVSQRPRDPELPDNTQVLVYM